MSMEVEGFRQFIKHAGNVQWLLVASYETQPIEKPKTSEVHSPQTSICLIAMGDRTSQCDFEGSTVSAASKRT